MKKYNIPIFIPHEGCPHACVFCNQKKITGVQTSVTTYDAERIIEEYLSFLPKDRYVEAAFFGGSFTGLPLEIQENFLKTANKYKNEIDGIRMSTRPDYINEEVLSLALRYNVKTIELGLQSADNDVLKLNEREHLFEDTKKAAQMIRDSGISLGLQVMIGMYGSTPEKDIMTAKEAAALSPSCVRIYPTLTLKGTRLEALFNEKKYVPYDLDTAIKTCDRVMNIFEEKGIDIIRVGLHSDESLLSDGNIVAGPYHESFKELVLGYRWRNKIEKEIIEKNIRNTEYKVVANAREMSVVYGHKRCNTEYFKTKFGVKITVDANGDL